MERHWHSGFTQWLFAEISVRTHIGILQETVSCLSGGTILSPANKQVKIIPCAVLRHGGSLWRRDGRFRHSHYL